MAEAFDPYREWLGLPTQGRVPNHYSLLGLKLFEADGEAIARAADAAMAKVRRVRPGEHAAEWSQLLDRLTTAKNCLLDASNKKAYDDKLQALRVARAAANAQTPNAARPASIATPPVKNPVAVAAAKPARAIQENPLLNEALLSELAPLSEIAPAPLEPVLNSPSKSTSFNVPPVVTWAVLGVLTLVLVVVCYVKFGRGPAVAQRTPMRPVVTSVPAPVAPAPKPSPAPPKAPAPPPPEQPSFERPAPSLGASKTPPAEIGGRGRSFGETPKPAVEKAKPYAKEVPDDESEPPVPVEPKKSSPPKPAPANTAKDDADSGPSPSFVKAVAEARNALVKRNMKAAENQIRIVEREADSEEDREQADRLRTMLENLTQFWDGIRASLPKLQAAEELVIKDKRIVVVESSRERLVVKLEGRVHRFDIATLPTSVVMLFVERNFGRDAGSKAIIGTFLAVDPSGDRGLAKKYFREAADAGFDAEKLIAEVDAMPPVTKKR